MATLLIRFTQAPYQSSASQDGLDFSLAATNYGHEVIVLFEHQGVLQLNKTESVRGTKNHSKRLGSLPFFDIEECYVCEESLKLSLLNNDKHELIAQLDASLLSIDEKLALSERVDHVVTF